jgi:hypothetical protein
MPHGGNKKFSCAVHPSEASIAAIGEQGELGSRGILWIGWKLRRIFPQVEVARSPRNGFAGRTREVVESENDEFEVLARNLSESSHLLGFTVANAGGGSSWSFFP